MVLPRLWMGSKGPIDAEEFGSVAVMATAVKIKRYLGCCGRCLGGSLAAQ